MKNNKPKIMKQHKIEIRSLREKLGVVSMTYSKTKIETKELEVPETIFIRDIENRVFQGIVLQCLAKIKGITLVEGNFIDTIFNRGTTEGIKGIQADQDGKKQTVSIKIEVNICYGIPIPEKAEEIQSKVAEDITKLTGLHVSLVHVVIKNVVTEEQTERFSSAIERASQSSLYQEAGMEEEYTEEF